MMICLIDNYRKKKDLDPSALSYLGHIHFGSRSPEAYFPLMTPDDRSELNSLFNGHAFKIVEPDDLASYCLDIEMLDAYRKGNSEKFECLRRPLLLKTINTFLAEYL